MFLFEQAINIADALGDLKTGWELRIQLMNDAEMSGYGDRTIVALAWCLGLADKHPDEFHAKDVLWQLKWVVPNSVCYANIPRRTIMLMLDELETRYRKAGWGMRAVHHKRMSVHWELGDLDEVQKYMSLWQAAPRDAGSDCLACERDQVVELHTLFGEHEQAIRAAKPLIQERQACSHVPQRTYHKLLFPSWALGRYKEALELQRKGLKATRSGLEYMRSSSRHALFAACIGNSGDALAILERRLPDSDLTPEEDTRLEFQINAAATLRALRNLGHSVGNPLQAVRATDIPFPTTDLRVWEEHLISKATSLASRFDARAGNSYRAGRLKQALELADQAPIMSKQAASIAPSEAT